MYSLLDYSQDGPVLHFVYASLGLDDRAWHHTMLAQPCSDWLQETLVPLAAKSEKAPTTREVVQCVAELAEREKIPVADVDWLGLALLAQQSFCETAATLAVTDTPELRRQLAVFARLEETLSEAAEESAIAVQGSRCPLGPPKMDP
jgi:hypothetical protein